MTRIWYTGAPRTGTVAVARFFSALGVKTSHQPDPKWIKLMYDRWDQWPYGTAVPEPLQDYVAKRLAASNGAQVECFYELAHYFGHAVDCWNTPDLVIVGIRNPVFQCNSVKHMLRGEKPRVDEWWRRMDLDFYALYYRRLYRWIAEQTQRYSGVLPRVRWVSFEALVRGQYDDALMRAAGIEPTDERRAQVAEIWNTRHNHRGKYPIGDSDLFPSCFEAARQCKAAFAELGT